MILFLLSICTKMVIAWHRKQFEFKSSIADCTRFLQTSAFSVQVLHELLYRNKSVVTVKKGLGLIVQGIQDASGFISLGGGGALLTVDCG